MSFADIAAKYAPSAQEPGSTSRGATPPAKPADRNQGLTSFHPVGQAAQAPEQRGRHQWGYGDRQLRRDNTPLPIDDDPFGLDCIPADWLENAQEMYA